MDESWRMRMGMPTAPPPPRRRSMEDAASRRRNPISDNPLYPEDFNDVFGGAPRTILSSQFSTSFQRSPPSSSTSYFYQEIFRTPEKAPPPVGRSGRSLPEFRIPGQRNNDFYSDIFGWEDHERVVRSRSRSKASSSSVLSSEELSPLRPTVSVHGSDDVSYFSSKLRPINVRSPRKKTHDEEDYLQRQQNMMLPFGFTDQPFYNTEQIYPNNVKSSYSFRLSQQNTSPETISLEPISNSSFRDDLELNSPISSVVSSSVSELKMTMDEEEEKDETMSSSYVIEINLDNREGATRCESNGVDEAIAWAKEKFQTHSDMSKGHQVYDQRHTDSFGSLDEQQDKWVAEEETEQFEYTVHQTEMQKLDEKIRLWSSDKEAGIRLLLSSLHQILWPNSGWSAMPLTHLTEISQVKKAYQKARLCLHPDKLQQRGASILQKYSAKKAFSVLQDAWAAFMAQEVL